MIRALIMTVILHVLHSLGPVDQDLRGRYPSVDQRRGQHRSHTTGTAERLLEEDEHRGTALSERQYSPTACHTYTFYHIVVNIKLARNNFLRLFQVNRMCS